MSAPYCRTANEVPDLRLWLRDRWKPGEPFARTAAVSNAARSIGENPDPQSWSRWEHDSLQSASLWWVSADMVELLLATAAGVPDDVTDDDLQHLDHSGFIVFERPWWGLDAVTEGHKVQVDGLVWSRAVLAPSVVGGSKPVVCWSVSMYRRLDFDAGLSQAELGLAVTTGAFEYAQLEAEAIEHDGKQVRTQYGAHGCAWTPLGRSDWVIGDRIDHESYPMDETMLRSYVEDRKVLAAFWMLMHQEGIASRTELRPPRQTVRRSERAGIDRELSRVNVVRLRRLSHPTDEHGDEHERKEHDHRWLVSGHWRWQPCGPGRRERRLTFVRPHIKGPDDKPLVVRDKVNAWVR